MYKSCSLPFMLFFIPIKTIVVALHYRNNNNRDLSLTSENVFLKMPKENYRVIDLMIDK